MFYRKEIRDLLAYLKVIAGLDDEVSRCCESSTRRRGGIGDAAVEKLTMQAVRSGRTVWDVITRADGSVDTDGNLVVSNERPEMSTKAAAGIGELRSVIERFRDEFETLVQLATLTSFKNWSRRFTTKTKSSGSIPSPSSSSRGEGGSRPASRVDQD